MLIPYRVKNRARRFPFATVALIAANVVIYLLTTERLLTITKEVVEHYGFAWGKTPFVNMLTAVFLHAGPLHLIGNMLFFWVFGPSVEDRLGIPRYFGVYLATGLAGTLLQTALDMGSAGQARYGIGASGCIMGVLGAYWYLFSWSPVCVFWWYGFRFGVFEMAAIWVIGLYLFLDMMEGILVSSIGGGAVAYFAHVGGGLTGVLICIAMRAERDTAELSEARAIHADVKDVSLLPVHALQTMLEHDPGNPELIRAMLKPALDLGQHSVLQEVMAQAGPALIDKDPALVADYLLSYRGDVSIYQPRHLLRLAGIMERQGKPLQALYIYRLLTETHPASPEVEMALYRMALVHWNTEHNAATARNCLREMARRFPKGEMSSYGRELWDRIA